MAYTLLSLLLFSLIPFTLSRPRAVVLPLAKDPTTLQHTTRIYQRTPLVPIKLVLDLGGQSLWVDCDKGYVSSTYKPVKCSEKICELVGSAGCGHCQLRPGPGCHNDTCSFVPDNTVVGMATTGEMAVDVVAVRATDGLNPGRVVTVPRFPLTCGSTFLLTGLAKGVKGMAGLGRTAISLPSQFSSSLKFHRTFAICLSSSTRSSGVVFFGDSPYNFLPDKEISKFLTYTPLIMNPHSTASANVLGDPSSEYFIGVKSIKINGHAVPLNKTLLSIDKEGKGGTKISTVNPYTIMETSIYTAFTQAFIKELSRVPRVAPVAPFKVCYNSKTLGSTRVGPGVPPVELILQKERVSWMFFGANSMVQVKENVLCLGFVDGGAKAWTSIVIGAHQIEDNLLQFDLGKSRLGFTSLLFKQTTCGNFNFTIKG